MGRPGPLPVCCRLPLHGQVPPDLRPLLLPESLAEAQIHTGPALWVLEGLTCNSGSGTIPSAAVCLWNRDGTVHRHAVIGDGPIDAVFKAIEHITGIDVTLRDYRLRSVTVGEDAQGEAHVEAEYNGRVVNGRAVSTDIIEASALAFLQVINRIALRKGAGERILPTETPPREAVSAV